MDLNLHTNYVLYLLTQALTSIIWKTDVEIRENELIDPTQSNGSLQWRHNVHNSVSNHQLHDCLLNRLFRRRLTKTAKLRVTGLCAGNSPGTRKMFPFDYVIMVKLFNIALI